MLFTTTVQREHSPAQVAPRRCGRVSWPWVNQQAVDERPASVGFVSPAIYWIPPNTNNYTGVFPLHNNRGQYEFIYNLFHVFIGYDLCTGWGTPPAANSIAALSTPEPLQLLSSANLAFNGLVGGPFTPPGELTLTNVGGQLL